MTDIVKIGMLAVAGVLLAIPLKKEKGEYSSLLGITICVLIFSFVITKIEVVFAFIKQLEGMLSIESEYIFIMLKMIGIAYIAEFVIGICKDAGFSAISGQIEIFAKISILVVSLPLLHTFLEMMGSLL